MIDSLQTTTGFMVGLLIFRGRHRHSIARHAWLGRDDTGGVAEGSKVSRGAVKWQGCCGCGGGAGAGAGGGGHGRGGRLAVWCFSDIILCSVVVLLADIFCHVLLLRV